MQNALQGNMGLGKAIEYFTSHQIPVSLPLNDTQKYDLIVDIDGSLKRVSVKTSRFAASENSYAVLLKNCGGSSGKSKTRYFDNTSADLLFIYTADNRIYLIPTEAITAKTGITVGNMYTEYEVFVKTLKEYGNEMEG